MTEQKKFVNSLKFPLLVIYDSLLNGYVSPKDIPKEILKELTPEDYKEVQLCSCGCLGKRNLVKLSSFQAIIERHRSILMQNLN